MTKFIFYGVPPLYLLPTQELDSFHCSDQWYFPHDDSLFHKAGSNFLSLLSCYNILSSITLTSF